MAAMQKGIPLPELPDTDYHRRRASLHHPQANPRWPIGAGAILMMIGIGICLALSLSGDEYHNSIWSFGLIPMFFGGGLILHYFVTRASGK
jgi:hypothetical protein